MSVEELRHVHRCDRRVIAERRGQQVAVGIVGAIFEQRCADAVRRRSVHLPFDNPRIYRFAAIVHAGISQDLWLEGLPIHFDDRRMDLRRISQREIAVLALDVGDFEIRMKNVAAVECNVPK